MSRNGVETNGSEPRMQVCLPDAADGGVPPAGELGKDDLKRSELQLKRVAEELSSALGHMEQALFASKGAGFSGRVQELFDQTQALQRETAREFGRKVGDRLGRESLWQVKKGLDVG